MIQISYNGSNDMIGAAVIHANKLFTHIPFLDAIYNLKKFDMATITPRQVTDLICNADIQLTVDTYWPLRFSSAADAYDDKLEPRAIHLNRLKINRPVHSICNTLVHQSIHALNACYPSYYFGHGCNNPVGKEHTAPFRIAALAQQIIAKDKKAVQPMLHEEPGNIQLAGHSSTQVQEALYHEGIFCIYDVMDILEAN
ncbi:MAG: hypothetical protein H3C54_13335 [Taibaiella sp.]|nr:hypothetical protein [Taibaiella sp.]